MKSRVMMAIAVAALVMLVSATMVQAVALYSENFDGPGVVSGQSVCDAPLGWVEIVPDPNNPSQRIYLGNDSNPDPNWPIRGFTGNFLDGSTATGDYSPRASIKKSLTVPAHT